jgi:8-amino-7-oxononanoate synthase
MDLFEKCRNFTAARQAQAAGLYPYFVPLEESEGTEVIVEGHRLIMIGSNNYLGLTTHPRVRQAAMDAVARYGTSCTGSRFLNGTLTLHHELEQRLAAFVGKESALVFSTGYQANLGAISALVGRGDVVIADKEDHASIVDGCQLALGQTKRYPHNDMVALERQLQSVGPNQGALVVVDGVFSMGGDDAPLPQMAALCKQYGARLMVDDAHGLGVMGPQGRGTSAHFGLTDQVDLIMGTFSKSFASLGGFIAASEEVIHYIQHHARALIFSASMPASNTAAVLAALDAMENEPEHVQRLWENAEYVRAGFKEMGFNTGPSTTPIIPLIIGEDVPTFLTWRMLFESGVYTNAVVSPGVPPGTSRLRTSYMATHTREQLDRVLAIVGEVGQAMGLIGPEASDKRSIPTFSFETHL